MPRITPSSGWSTGRATLTFIIATALLLSGMAFFTSTDLDATAATQEPGHDWEQERFQFAYRPDNHDPTPVGEVEALYPDQLGIYFNWIEGGATANRDGDDVLSLRLYGEENQAPPELYQTREEAFDPAVIPKDSVTFNPAIILHTDDDFTVPNGGGDMSWMRGCDEEDSNLKKHLRTWYEPNHEFNGPRAEAGFFNPPTRADVIQVETTYYLVSANDYQPNPICAGDARFPFPTEGSGGALALLGAGAFPGSDTTAWPQPGLTTMREVRATSVEAHPDPSRAGEGTVQLESQGETLTKGTAIQMFDHVYRYDGIEEDFSGNMRAKFTVWYAGNTNLDSRTTILLGGDDVGTQAWLSRANNLFPDPKHPVENPSQPRTSFIEVNSFTADTVTFDLGKEIRGGDTFYVDGVRYDFPSVFVEHDGDRGKDVLHQLTVRTPLPKSDPAHNACPQQEAWSSVPNEQLEDLNREACLQGQWQVQDWSVVSTQRIIQVNYDEPIPVNPPFNHEYYRQVDDTDVVLWEPGPAQDREEECATAEKFPWGERNDPVPESDGLPYFPLGHTHVAQQGPPQDWLDCWAAEETGFLDLGNRMIEGIAGITEPGINHGAWALPADTLPAIPEPGLANFYWVKEWCDSRFSTNLLQILKENDLPSYTKYGIDTQPCQFTEFVLPDRSNPHSSIGFGADSGILDAGVGLDSGKDDLTLPGPGKRLNFGDYYVHSSFRLQDGETRLGFSHKPDAVIMGVDLGASISDGLQGDLYVQTLGLLATGAGTGEKKLTAGDGSRSDRFGWSVALDGDRLLIGARTADIGGNTNQGAAYVFEYDGTDWFETQKLTASDGAASDSFGESAALDGDRLIIGAPRANIGGNTDQGAAYVFEHDGTNWVEVEKLIASDGATFNQFGTSVALDGDRLLIGAHGATVGGNANQGAAYVFERVGTNWVETQKLTASDGAAGDSFGGSVSLDGDRLLIGTHQANIGANTNQGAAYVFEYDGTSWIETQKLTASDGAAHTLFGGSVVLDGDRLLIGAIRTDVGGNSWQGAAYVFEYDGTNWVETQKLTASDGADFDRFGWSLALDGDRLLIATPFAQISGNTWQGAVYVFEYDGTDWLETQKLTASDGAASDELGHSVSLDGDRLLVGAPIAAIEGTRQGAAYVFQAGSAPEEIEGVTTLRVYGAEGEGAIDFTEYWHAFDPYAIGKDSVTFNPAIVLHEDDDFTGHDQTFAWLKSCDESNSNLKKTMRMWYEPRHVYDGPRVESGATAIPTIADVIQLESSYKLVDADSYVPRTMCEDGRIPFPVEGYNAYTHPDEGFVITGDAQPGLNTMRSVKIGEVSGSGTAGSVELIRQHVTLEWGEAVQMFDHLYVYMGVEDDFADPDLKKAKFRIYYLGNPAADSAENQLLGGEQRHYVSRANNLFDEPSHGWNPDPLPVRTSFIDLTGGTFTKDSVTFSVGKVLQKDDTFYVNGIRYDVPAIYVKEDPLAGGELGVQYITMRTALPKSDPNRGDGDGTTYTTVDTDQVEMSPSRKTFDNPGAEWVVRDESVVSTQRIREFNFLDPLPLNPPFNHEFYRMVDDTDVQLWELGPNPESDCRDDSLLEHGFPWGPRNDAVPNGNGLPLFPNGHKYLTMQNPPQDWIDCFDAEETGYLQLGKRVLENDAPSEPGINHGAWEFTGGAFPVVPAQENTDFFWVSEWCEGRFNTNLLQLVGNDGAYGKLQVDSEPCQYTEFVLPDRSNPHSELAAELDTLKNDGVPAGLYKLLGGDYLLTSSWRLYNNYGGDPEGGWVNWYDGAGDTVSSGHEGLSHDCVIHMSDLMVAVNDWFADVIQLFKVDPSAPQLSRVVSDWQNSNANNPHIHYPGCSHP